MISLVIPIFNEELVIDELLERSLATMKGIGEHFEIIIVDDGSEDASLQKLLDFREKDERVKVIELSRNFGHQAALTAGVDAARGQAVVIIDGDMQRKTVRIIVLDETRQDRAIFRIIEAWPAA